MKVYRKPPPESFSEPAKPLTIETMFYDDDRACFTAEVRVGSDTETITVDDCYGTWRVPPRTAGDSYREVAIEYAVKLAQHSNDLRRKLNMPVPVRHAYGRS